MKQLIVLITLLLMSVAYAQQPDIPFLQRAIAALQAQRNQAYDQAVMSEAKATGALEDLSKAQARIKELEDKTKTEVKPTKDK